MKVVYVDGKYVMFETKEGFNVAVAEVARKGEKVGYKVMLDEDTAEEFLDTYGSTPEVCPSYHLASEEKMSSIMGDTYACICKGVYTADDDVLLDICKYLAEETIREAKEKNGEFNLDDLWNALGIH